MAEYIDRGAAIEALVGLTIYSNAPALNAAVESAYHNGREWIGGVRDALIEIGDLPAADVVERKKGLWALVEKRRKASVYRCSECGNFFTVWPDTLNCGRGDMNYCPNCGADMREQEGMI